MRGLRAMSRLPASKFFVAELPELGFRRLRRHHHLRSLAAMMSMAVAASTALVRAEDPDGARVVAGIEQQVRAIFEKCRPAVVKIEAADTHGRLSGTGFFIDPNGTLYTSYSVG